MGSSISRVYGGQLKPRFGYEAFHRFEQAYLRLCLQQEEERAVKETYIYDNLPSLSYNDFVARIHCNNILPKLIGLRQNNAHKGVDPLRHTYNALQLLDLSDPYLATIPSPPGFRRPIGELLQIALLYHDLGKVKGPRDENHPQHSAELAERLLCIPVFSGVGSLTEQERSFIVTLIRTHHLIGDINKYGTDIQTAIQRVRNELVGAFSLREMFYFHLLIATADINSVPIVKARIVPARWLNYTNAIFQALEAA